MKILDGIVGLVESEKGVLELILLVICSVLLFTNHLDAGNFKSIVLGTVGLLFTAHTISDVMGGNDSDNAAKPPPPNPQ